MNSWPLKMYACCYEATDYPGGWVPYSGEMFWYRDKAEEARKRHPHSKVRVFYVGLGPRFAQQRNENG